MNDELAARLLEAGRAEIFAKGFQKASVRRIAASAGVTTGAFYRYYSNKHALFDALVREPAESLYQRYLEFSEAFSRQDLDQQLAALPKGTEGEMSELVDYMYRNYGAFKLIACHAEGTRYADYIERLIAIETKTTAILIRMMNREKAGCVEVDDQLIHILSSTFFTGVFEIIAHDEPIDLARRHLALLQEFHTAGWLKILGIG